MPTSSRFPFRARTPAVLATALVLVLAACDKDKPKAAAPAPAQTAARPAPPPELKDIIEHDARYVVGISFPPEAKKYPGLATALQAYADGARAELLKAVQGADPAKPANVKAKVDIVLPVASEADCRNCHNGVDGIAAVFAKTTTYRNGTPWTIATEASAPGPDKVNNAAKINVLRLHDAMAETEAYGYEKVRQEQIALGRQVRELMVAHGYPSVAAEGFQAPGVVVVDEAVIVEIVRPGTGDPVPAGEVGEVVVTVFNPDYPLIRLATGDLSAVLPGRSPCGRSNMRIRGWLGRADQATKVRGMFVQPRQLDDVLRRPGEASVGAARQVGEHHRPGRRVREGRIVVRRRRQLRGGCLPTPARQRLFQSHASHPA